MQVGGPLDLPVNHILYKVISILAQFRSLHLAALCYVIVDPAQAVISPYACLIELM